MKTILKSIALRGFPFCATTFLTILFVFNSCGRADLNVPYSTDGAIPKPVTVTNVENISGASIINYQLPDDKNINYVEAVYMVKGEEVRQKASFYTKFLTVDAFPESKEYEVKLYSVSHSEVRSEPTVTTVFPKTPPYIEVAHTLQVEAIFGGVKSAFNNPTKAPLQITFLEKDELGGWSESETIYTSLPSGTFYVRGLDAREYTFGVVSRDRWQNVSDTMMVTLTPMFEQLHDYSKISSYPLPTDLTYEYPRQNELRYHRPPNGAGDIENLWNGETKAPWSASSWFFIQNIKTNIEYAGLPSSLTMDLGQKVRLSRFVPWPRNGSGGINKTHLFDGVHLKTFELWGSNNPSADGSYDSWTLLGTFESHRVSGNTTPGDQYSTAEDREVAFVGESYDISEEFEPFRYIRFKALSTWGGTLYWAAGEFQFFGQPL